MKITAKFLIGLGVLAVLSPLGLLLPENLKAGSAWGEWGVGQMQKLVGYIPKGMEKLSGLWSAPLPDYVFKGWQVESNLVLSFSYILSAVIGILICVGVVFILGKFLSKK